MIKLRIQGTPKDVERFQAFLESLPRIEVLETSGSYANRGKSQYVRVYTEVAFKQVATVNEEFEKLFEEGKQ